jgi:hypothetical protein
MAVVPLNLGNLVETLNRDVAEFPEWEIELLGKVKSNVQIRIKEHFDATAATRQKFVSMSKTQWQEEGTGLFVLTERPKLLGYLPEAELARLNNMVLGTIQGEIETIRSQLNEIMPRIRASAADQEEIAPLLARNSFLFHDLEDHHTELEKWSHVQEKKVPILEELGQREDFLEEVEQFEIKSSGNPDRYKSRNSLKLSEENKFRGFAAKKLVELQTRAILLCEEFEKEMGTPFRVDGRKYLDMITEQGYGRPSNPYLSLAKLSDEFLTAAEVKKHQEFVANSDMCDVTNPNIIRNPSPIR